MEMIKSAADPHRLTQTFYPGDPPASPERINDIIMPCINIYVLLDEKDEKQRVGS